MKKSIASIKAAAAVLVGSACIAGLSSCLNTEPLPQAQSPRELTFKSSSDAITRAGELSGTSIDGVTENGSSTWKPYAMYVSATQYDNGYTVENPSFFTGEVFRNAAKGETEWRHYESETATSAAPIYWPLGGAVMNYLAVAMPIGGMDTLLNAEKGGANIAWDSSASARGFRINQWNTYKSQVDLLYGATNDTNSEDYGEDPEYVMLQFSHAQALLVFNIRINDNSTDFVVNDISFVDTSYIRSRNAELKDGTAPGATTPPTMINVRLLTLGNFVIDNSRVNLTGTWENLSTHVSNWRMPMTTALQSPCNSSASGVIQYGDKVTSDSWKQLGETLLVPEQKKANFTICYTVGGNHMQYTFNNLRGTWQAGRKYVYNIDVNINEMVLTEQVTDFVLENTPVPVL